MNNDLTSRDGNDDHRRYIPRLLDDVVSGVIGTTAFVTQHAEPVSPIETYETFDRRDGGWLETVRTVDRIGAQGRDNGNAHSERRTTNMAVEAKVWDEFREAVNMSPAELGKWLETDESGSVGMTGSGRTKSDSGGPESKGHESGREIVAILHTKKGELTDDDAAQMKRVVQYVHRHLAQRPSGEVEHSRWRYSLMNWGHDPMKK